LTFRAKVLALAQIVWRFRFGALLLAGTDEIIIIIPGTTVGVFIGALRAFAGDGRGQRSRACEAFLFARTRALEAAEVATFAL